MAQIAQVVEVSYPQDTAAVFCALRHWPQAVWLDSSHPYTQQGRYDIMAARPLTTLTTLGNSTTITSAKGTSASAEDPYALLRQAMPPAHTLPEPHNDLPFCGGAIGYWGYDLARRLENLPQQATADIHLPDMWVGIYPWALVVDHQQQQAWITALAGTDLAVIMAVVATEAPQKESNNSFNISHFKSNLNEASYIDKVGIIKQHIRDGDCYQVNFAQRFSARYRGDTLAAYLALRQCSPAPFAAYLALPEGNALLCHSPERFIACHEGEAITCPIKGTIARGQSAEEDLKNRAQLLSSPKDRAENLMIVDLLRNDLSRTCRQVKTPQLFELQSFASVHHLVSTITGALKPGEDSLSLLREAFPGGSITGAPKIRAMEIIEALESHRRGPYCGSIGYISASGRMDTNIAIRTLIADEGNMHCYGGGGIVADSDPAAEYQESLTKISLLMETLNARFTPASDNKSHNTTRTT